MESLQHAQLVVKLAAEIERRHPCERTLVVLADHVSFGVNRPWRINGFVPDVFAQDLPATFEVIGEAKTPLDLETDRSLRQIRGFLDHLELRGSGFFYLAVPWWHLARAQLVLAAIKAGNSSATAAEAVGIA